MKLSEKDRELIAAEQIGKAFLKSFPGIDDLLKRVTDDKDVRNVMAGTGIQRFLAAVAKASKGKM